MTPYTRYSRTALKTADDLFPERDGVPRSGRLGDIAKVVRGVFLDATAQIEAAYGDDKDLSGIFGILASAIISHAVSIDGLDTPTGIAAILRAQVGTHADRMDVCPAAIFEAFVRGIPDHMARHRKRDNCANEIKVEVENKTIASHTSARDRGEPS
jgi:hypothetical protein